MKVSVRFLGPFRRYSEATVVDLDLTGEVTVLAALQMLGSRLGTAFQEEVLDHLEEVKSLVLLNHENLPEGRWHTVLSDGDTISLVPPMGGG